MHPNALNLTLFTDDRPLPRRELSLALLARGWHVRFLGQDGRPLPDERPIDGMEEVLGWRGDDPDRMAVEQRVCAGELDSVADHLGWVSLEAHPEVPRLLDEDVHLRGVRSALRKAKRCYNLLAGVGEPADPARTDELRRAVFDALCRLKGGVSFRMAPDEPETWTVIRAETGHPPT